MLLENMDQNGILININFYQIFFSTIYTPNHRRSSGPTFQYFLSSHVVLRFVKCALQTVDCQVFCLFAMLWDLTGSGANLMCLLQSALIETPVSQTEKWTMDKSGLHSNQETSLTK